MNLLRSAGAFLVMSFLLIGCGSNNGTTTNNGVVTTIAGTAGVVGSTDATGPAARFSHPYGITKLNGNLYITDRYNNTIRKIAATGAVTTIAGSAGTQGSSDGTGAAASFYNPFGITNDGTNLYVTDTYNNTIRKIVPATGAVTTIAGTAGTAGSSDGTGAAATFSAPHGIVTDGTNLYVADIDNHTIRKIVIATGAVTTIAGTAGAGGSSDGTGAAARFYFPIAITTDGTNLYVAEMLNHTIRRIVISTGAVTTVAGTAGTSGSTDGIGPAARFFAPQGITVSGTTLYVSDTGNHTIRTIDTATGTVKTLAGSAGTSGSTDSTGPAARFFSPIGIIIDGSTLYVSDNDNCTIRMIQ